MDAITLLKKEHQQVEQLFKRFEQSGDRAYVAKREIVDRIIEALSKHAAIEEMLFYPVARATVPGTDDVVLESLEEHHVVKWLLSELDGMDPEAERFDAKVTVLIENVRHHVEEEEQEFFPKVREELGRAALNDLGDTMVTARDMAPTHPHPTSPDSPPANVVVGAAAGVADRVTDTVSGVAQGTVSLVQDVIDRILGRQRRRPAAKGSPRARKVAADLRQDGIDVTDSAIQAAKEAKRAAERTTVSAARGAKRTASTARTGAKRTAATARTGAKRTAATARKKKN